MHLAEELGLDPTPALQELERQILLQSPALDHRPPRKPSEPTTEESIEGTLAFLFTDIESSTGRWEGGKAAMSVDLARHDALLGEAIGAHAGRLFTHTGDGVGAAFPTAANAIAAAVEGQLALARVEWQGTAPMRVRMAIHVGAAEARAGTFLGPTLNRTARLLDEAAGAEILCSQAVADLARDDLPDGVTLVDLGDRQLEGLSRKERVWQVRHTALPEVCRPTPPSPSRAPAPLTSFVGREAELAELCELLPRTRLLTIAGVGGVGKTRLALELAARMSKHFAGGHTVVELATVTDSRLLAPEILAALGVDAGGPTGAEEQLVHVLARRELLLVLDNCEHILEPVAALVHRVLAGCDTVTLLVTSREVLSLPGEAVWTAPGLSLPPPDGRAPAELDGSDAATLFVTRAGTAQSGFGVTDANVAPITRICRSLDGLPLALELAAARVRVLGVAEIAERLDDRFRLLTGAPRSSPSRHQTLRAAMEWSFDLLPPPERQLLARFSVFPQSFDLAAATAVAGENEDPLVILDRLARLIDKSLLIPEGAAGTARYRLLETVRQYAAEVLSEAGSDVETRLRHRRHFTGWIERTFRPGAQLLTDWGRTVDADRENCHAALVGAVDDGDMESATVLIAGAHGPWFWRFSVPEVLDRVDPEALWCPNPGFLVEAHIGLMLTGLVTGRFGWEDAMRILERARIVADEAGTGIEQGFVRYYLGYATRSQGDNNGARTWQEAARDRFSQHPTLEGCWPYYELGWIDMTEDAVEAARAHFRHALQLIDGEPGYEFFDAHFRAGLALAEAATGHGADGLAHARKAVDTARWLNWPGALVMALMRCAQTAAVAGDPSGPELIEALHILRDSASGRWVAETLTLAALSHESQGRAEVAARLLGGAAAVAASMGEKPQPLPVIARLVADAKTRLVATLGAEGFAEYESAGRNTSVAGLLQYALGGRSTSRDR